MASLGQFSRRIQVLGDRIEKNANLVKRKVALAVDQAVVLGTPVDTGNARSNWLVSLSQPRQDQISPYAPGNKLGRGERANAQNAINQGASVVGVARTGQDIYIVNNVDYIGDLNQGSSRQAPANFVEMAVLSGSQVVNSARVLISRI